MEREVSVATQLGVAMCILAAFISIIMVSVRVGNATRTSAYNAASEVQTKVESGTLKELRGTDKEMSIAAVFGIIENGDDFIGVIDASRIVEGPGLNPMNYKTKAKSIEYIQNHLSGRCRLDVVYNEALGTYTLTLHETQCAWLYGACSCTY